MINFNRLSYELKRNIVRYSEKISIGLTRPQFKFVTQMLYGLLDGKKAHLSEIARSLKEDITLKKTIDRLSRNLSSFNSADCIMENYMKLAKSYVKENAILIIDNSDIAKPCSKQLEALSEVRDGSTGEIVSGYQTIDAAVLSQSNKMPLPVYTKIFSAKETGFISETYENLECFKYLSSHFSKKCIRTLDRGFDANDYFEYFLKHKERFIIRLKMNRNIIYNGNTINVLDVVNKYKGRYKIHFKGKARKALQCKMSCIPVKACFAPKESLTLIAVYGFGKIPMMLLTNIKNPDEKQLANIITKVYLLRWRIEEYFKFKKQQFDFEDIRVWSLKSIRNFNLLATVLTGYIGMLSEEQEGNIFVTEILECSKRIYEIPKFVFYAIGYAMANILSKTKVGIQTFIKKRDKTQQLDLFKYLGLAAS
ncbi:MAG: transposase [Ruminiclostridium sp.]